MHDYIYKDVSLVDPDLYQFKINQSQNGLTNFTGIYIKSLTIIGTSVLVNVNQRQMIEWFCTKVITQRKPTLKSFISSFQT